MLPGLTTDSKMESLVQQKSKSKPPNRLTRAQSGFRAQIRTGFRLVDKVAIQVFKSCRRNQRKKMPSQLEDY